MGFAGFLNSLFALATLFAQLLSHCYCFNVKLINVSQILTPDQKEWQEAGATWYGSPDGDGSEGGACGYGSAVGQSPFSRMVSAGGSSVFDGGKGCGLCYQVKCTGNAACSGNPVTIAITDNCPDCPSIHFDLSGTAFGAMARPGQFDRLRNEGRIGIQYQRVPCQFGVSITFRVDSGSNPYYMATLIEYENDGEIKVVSLKQSDSTDSWIPMQQSWGAVWKLDSGSPLKAPLSIKLTNDVGKSAVADNVIPDGWQPGQTYRSVVNF